MRERRPALRTPPAPPALLTPIPQDEEHTETKAVTSNGGYRYELPEEKAAMKAQRAAVWHWLRGIGMHVLRDGFSLISISMPVTLFEPRSWLERMCDKCVGCCWLCVWCVVCGVCGAWCVGGGGGRGGGTHARGEG